MPTGTPVPKPTRTPKDQRTPNPFKPDLRRERIRDHEQTPRVKPKADDADMYRVTGSCLRTIGKKRLRELEANGGAIGSTFRRKPGQRPLQHKRQVNGHRITALQQRPDGLKRGVKLKVVGRRGKRLAPGDRAQEAASHILPCVCGCNAHLQPGADGIPGKGLISRAHLESRRFESTRNEDWNNLPACAYLSDWLDHNHNGEQARGELLDMAKALGRRLTHTEAGPVISRYGYYTELARKRGMER